MGKSSSTGGKGMFRTTRWSLVLNSVYVQAPKSRAALSELCKLYWYPLYAFARRSGHDALDAEDAENRYRLEPADDLTPEKVFDARWATVLLSRVTARLRAEYVRQGKGRTFERLKVFLVAADHENMNSYRQIADELGLTVGGIKTLVFRLRKDFTGTLREEVAQTLVDPADVDSELRALCDALLASGAESSSKETHAEDSWSI